MTVRQSSGKRIVYSDSNALSAIGKALMEIKYDDELTWADMGKVLGVCADMATKYANGETAMSALTFGRAKKEWNGRFTGYFDRLCEDSRPGIINDHGTLTNILDLSAKLSAALEDGEIDQREVQHLRSELENVRDMLDAQLGKLRVVA